MATANGPKTVEPKLESWFSWHAIKQVKWGMVWRRQDHANLLLTAILIVGVGISAFVIEPRTDVFYIYDATISQPPGTKRGFDPTVPEWAAIVIPLLMMVCTIIVGEFFYSKKQHHSLTDAFAVSLYFLLDGLQSLACVLLVTMATKVAVGRPRPDFLARCNPQNALGQPAVVAFGEDTFGDFPCTGPAHDIKDGRQSFPSGHTSFSFNLTAYASIYLIWCWNMRREWVPRCLGPWQEFLSDLGNVCAKMWLIVMLGVAWGISMSRIIDNQHHPSDVVAGMVLGVLIALIYITRAIPRYSRVLTAKCAPCEQLQEERRRAAAAGGNGAAGNGVAVEGDRQPSGGLREEEEGRLW